MKSEKASTGKKFSPSAIAREAERIVANVRDFYVASPGRALIAIEKRHDDEPRDLIYGLLALGIGVKQIVVLDGAIDIRNPKAVESELTARVQPDRDVIVIPRIAGSMFDNAAPKRSRLGWGIDATSPVGPERPRSIRRSLTAATRRSARALAAAALCLVLSACSANQSGPENTRPAAAAFGPERRIGQSEKNPSTPFLRAAPDGRLYAVWTEDESKPVVQVQQAAAHSHGSGKMAPSPMRAALLAWSADGGESWSPAKRVNSEVEAVQGEENGPKVAFGPDKRAHVVWSIPGAKGDKTRANIRFALEDGNGGFTPARTLNEVKDTARFPIVETAPDGTLLIAWIDRRLDNPQPRQLYLMRFSPDGRALTNNYKVGEGLCECCRLGIAFADGGKTIYMVDRELNDKQIRNHAMRISTDGGATFGPPVEISDDGWQVPSCPHSGPTVGRDGGGNLHVTWFTLGRAPEKEAGIYYTVSNDGGKSFAPRRLVHGNTGPETLHATLAVGGDGTVYFVWSNLDPSSKSQIFFRALATDGKTWGPIQQISKAKENATRPALAISNNELHVAWTEIDGESSWIVMRSASLGK
jgi:hypothetical protein